MRIVVVEHHRYRAAVRVGSHHVARELVDCGHEVLWVSHARSWLHRFKERVAPMRTRHEDGVVEVIPRVILPYVDLPFLGSCGWGKRWLGEGALEPLRAELALRPRSPGDRYDCDLLWLSDCCMLPILDHLRSRRVVLRFFDHLDQFRWMPASIFDLVRCYQERADLIIASSQDLAHRLAAEGIESLYVPNGAHVRPEARRWLRTTPQSDRVVYVGAIERWFDADAVEYWAAALPHVHFDIFGPNRTRLESSLPNLHYPGPVPYENLPELLAPARFGLIPFKVNKLTRGIHPIKLYDYLMFGVPVLSAALPEVKPDTRGVFVYRDAQEGLELLRTHLGRAFDREALQELAGTNSWVKRLKTVFDRLGEPLRKEC